MAYNERIILKLFTYTNNAFKLEAMIDDFEEISFSDDMFEAGDFTITINYNIPNALKFERGMFVQFGNNEYRFGEILSISDSIGEDGEGSQVRVITGKDARYIFKRRVIKNLNNEENWAMTAKGEICLRELVKSQCGSSAEQKRQLPIINVIPAVADALGKEYSVAESFSNLYDTLVTIATQSEIGWRINFSNGVMTLECYTGTDRSNTVQFSTDFDSLANGEFKDSSESYANSIYIGGKGTGNDRDIYEGEQEISGSSPSGLDRYEAYDNQSSMTTESEYAAEAVSMLSQYAQTLELSGQGLAKSPYIYKQQYFVGDTITVAFSGKKAKVQILNVTENWSGRGEYGIEFTFGKPQNDLSRQLQLILKQIQKASNKTTTTASVKYYTIPDDTAMPKSDVIYDNIGFEGDCGENGATFQLYLDDEKTGAKTYHVRFKQLAGTGKLTLTTGKAGAQNLVMNSGTYVAIIYVDPQGNITMAGATTTNIISTNNNQPASSEAVANYKTDTISTGSELPVTSGAVAGAVSDISGDIGDLTQALAGKVDKSSVVDSVSDGDLNPVTSNAVYDELQKKVDKSSVVDSVTDGNQNPVTSNAVYDAISAAESRSKDLANATGVLPVAHGGTGQTSLDDVTVGTSKKIASTNITIKTGSTAQSKISLQTLMTWLMNSDRNYIPSGVDCYKLITTSWSYSGNDILQLTISGVNYELQLAGVMIEFMGKATTFNAGVFRLRIHSAPTTSFTETSGYTKFPTSHIAEYTCNGTDYSPTWKMLIDVGDTVKDTYNAYSLDKHVTCSTAAGTAAKTVSLPGFSLIKGARLIVYLNSANTAASALTLNVNSTGAKTIRWNGTVTSSSTYAMTAGYYNCYYDGTYWNMDSAYEARSARVASTADLATQADYTRGNAYCTTAAATQAKVANMRGYVLAVGAFPITFTNANTYNGKITLNVNTRGAKDIWINGAVSSSTNKTLPAGTYLCFYDGTKYMISTESPIQCDKTPTADSLLPITSDAVASALSNKADKTSLEWKILEGNILPSDLEYNEISISVWATLAQNTELLYSNTFAKGQLGGKQIVMIGGYYLSPYDFGLCNLNFINNEITLRNVYFDGQDIKSSASLKIRYR